ncbi:hypothetical protein GGR53DRAFT_470029 [Hypoxylon sp. FL1150]|nr:hypothetical protein GGR53DRAFT_470029 [Hypoxylon sp. FL1150]
MSSMLPSISSASSSPAARPLSPVWEEKPWQSALKEAHRRTRGTDAPLLPFLAVDDCDTEQFKKLLVEADLEPRATIAWSFLFNPVGSWKQSDEDTWDKSIRICVEELQKGTLYLLEGGVHKIRMIATIDVTEKK